MTVDHIEDKIQALKKQRNAVILVHNYQLPEVQDIADYVGDSLELSQLAARTDTQVIVFCGVHFMAETAAILSPQKTVLLPAQHAGCPMADMITAEQLLQLKQQHPQALVVCYVNSTAEIKAASDYCCTSANAAAVVNSLPDTSEIIFVPDKYLGRYVAEQTGCEMILWNGYCPTHVRIRPQDIEKMKKQYPQALALAHPECTEAVCRAADAVLSTGGMCRFAQSSPATEFIVATEIGIIHRLRKENPEKQFYAATDEGVCPNMKLTTLENVLWSLESMQHIIEVPEDVRLGALKAVENMIAINA